MNEIIDYERRDEVLFILYATDKVLKRPLSRIEVQKSIYLCNILSPLKNMILDYFNFKIWNHGPYSSEVQNTLNNLVALKYIRMDYYDYKVINDKIKETSYYSIDEKGNFVVNELVLLDEKKEQYEWTQSIIKMISIYGIENIVKIVYQEPTFKYLKERKDDPYGTIIPIYDSKQNKIIELFQFIKDIAEKEFGYILDTPEKVLLAIFDYLYSEIDNNADQELSEV